MHSSQIVINEYEFLITVFLDNTKHITDVSVYKKVNSQHFIIILGVSIPTVISS